MKVYVNIKKMAKRRNSVEREIYEIPDETHNVRELITAFVKILVEQYNSSINNEEFLKTLTQTQIEDAASSGKVSFGVNYNGNVAELEKAKQNALQCFEDGLYRIFLGSGSNSAPLTDLEKSIELKDGDELTFVRLTFLTGRMW